MADRNIIVSWLDKTPVSRGETELVERKGVGHPDSVSDGIAEAISRALSRMYMEECAGEILHHNVDQNEVSGGQSVARFGGGRVLDPPYIILLGRAVDEAICAGGKMRLPVRHTALSAARQYLRDAFHDPALKRESGFDFAEEVIIDARLGKGSQDLIQNYLRDGPGCPVKRECRPANDTSFGVGFAPFSDTERLTYEMERYINGDLKSKDGMSATGRDVKVMAARSGKKIHLTIACAMIASRVASAAEYKNLVAEMRSLCLEKARDLTELEVEASVNHADDYSSEDPSNYYITVTGLSLENGDDGSVGRGNRVNGLITPFRPMSMEAASGKNPVTHVGKLYNVLANQIANQVAAEAGLEITEVNVRLLSQIGSPIDRPAVASVELNAPDEPMYRKWKRRAEEIADHQLENIDRLTEQIVKGQIAVF